MGVSFDRWLDEVGLEWLSKKLKLHPRTVSNWRKRRAYPTVRHIQAIHKLSGRRVTYDAIINRRLTEGR